MIKVNKGEVNFEGMLPDIATEMVVAMKMFKKLCVEQMGEEDGNSFYENPINLVSMSNEELKQEEKRARERMLKRVLGIEE